MRCCINVTCPLSYNILTNAFTLVSGLDYPDKEKDSSKKTHPEFKVDIGYSYMGHPKQNYIIQTYVVSGNPRLHCTSKMHGQGLGCLLTECLNTVDCHLLSLDAAHMFVL